MSSPKTGHDEKPLRKSSCNITAEGCKTCAIDARIIRNASLQQSCTCEKVLEPRTRRHPKSSPGIRFMEPETSPKKIHLRPLQVDKCQCLEGQPSATNGMRDNELILSLSLALSLSLSRAIIKSLALPYSNYLSCPEPILRTQLQSFSHHHSTKSKTSNALKSSGNDGSQAA